MRIRIEGGGGSIHTTFAELLDAIQAVARNDSEIEVLLLTLLAEERLHVVSERPLAA